MTLWVILVVLLFAALAFVVLPLYRSSGKLTLLLAGVILFAAGLSASLYHRIGHPGVLSGAGSMPDVNEGMALLAERLAGRLATRMASVFISETAARGPHPARAVLHRADPRQTVRGRRSNC